MKLKDIAKMINPSYGLISEDFRSNQWCKNSDSTYLLRMMLFRAANEADRRYYLSTGEKAKEYRRITYELNELADDIEHYMNEAGRIKSRYKTMIFEAIILARHLILLDQSETHVQYETLTRNLFHPQADGWPYDLVA